MYDFSQECSDILITGNSSVSLYFACIDVVVSLNQLAYSHHKQQYLENMKVDTTSHYYYWNHWLPDMVAI
jgi:hypothetical protein